MTTTSGRTGIEECENETALGGVGGVRGGMFLKRHPPL